GSGQMMDRRLVTSTKVSPLSNKHMGPALTSMQSNGPDVI
ncbi:MAG: hypothetical protein ACI8W1_001857, partial [Candidatus Azotimanducaceae bacterium]